MTLPHPTLAIDQEVRGRVIRWTSMIFLGGLLAALPVLVALLFVNVGLGVVTRAAPSLNIFAVGFPALIVAGLLILMLAMDGIGARTETELARAVREALEWDAFVPDEKIASTVSMGIVTLEGLVQTWTQRADAERVVRGLSGVRGVINQISVSAKAVDPVRIKNEIEEALERQAEREARRIDVTVKDGVVTVAGRVRSWAEKNAIDRVVGFAPGVRRVDDQLLVDPYA